MRSFTLCFGFILIMFASCDVESDDPFVDPTLEQFNMELQEIDAYLSAEGLSATIDENSGIRYIINNEGDGLQPIVADSLTLSFQNSLLSTDAVVEEVEREKIRSSLLLDGIAIASTYIQEGGSVTAYIPSVYAYGPLGNSNVPENAIIIAELELIAVHNQQLMLDMMIIDDSLANSDTVALIHPTGVRYFIEQGTGESPTLSNSVTINYSGEFFNGVNAGVVFDNANNVNFSLVNLIVGWQIMIPEMKIGGKLTMILPSSFAYGPGGNIGASPAIGPNEILVFDVELIDFN